MLSFTTSAPTAMPNATLASAARRRSFFFLLFGVVVVGGVLTTIVVAKQPASLEELGLAWRDFIGSALGLALVLVLILGLVPLLRQRIQQAEAAAGQVNHILEATLDAIVIADRDGRIRSVNAAVERLFGYSRAELIGRRLEIILPRDSWDKRLKSPSGTKVQGTNDPGAPIDFMGQHKKGHYVPLEFVQSSLENGSETLLITVLRDASRRKQVEDSQRDQEAQLRLLFEQMPAIMWTTDTKLQITSTMGRGLTELNLRPNEVIGMSLLEHLKKDTLDATPIAAHLQALRGEALSYEMEWMGKHFQVRVEPLRNPARLITGTIGIVIDVTARKQAEQALQRKQQEMMEFFQTAAIGLHWVGPDGRILLANPAVLRLLGYRESEYVGLHVGDLHADPGVGNDLLSRFAAGEALRNREARLRCKDGTIKIVLIDTNPFLEEGKLVHTRCFLRDVTENKRLEEQLRQSQKMEAVGRLAGGIAHDFNNLLTIINGYSEMVMTTLAPEHPAGELVPEIRKAGDRAARLVSQLLTFSRHQVHLPSLMSLNELMQSLRDVLHVQLGERIELVTELAPDAGSVKADPLQLERVILNLTANSRDAMPDGGRVTLRTENVEIGEELLRQRPDVRPGPYVRLSVIDTGRGMDEATRGRIFEPFFTTKEQGRGMGLGLATAYGIIKQSKGYIFVESTLGQGTRFDIYLPRARESCERS